MKSITHPRTALHNALLLDAIASGGMGALLVLGATFLDAALGLSAGLMRSAGLVLMPFAAFLVHLARQADVSRKGVLAVIAINVVWVAESVLVVVAGWAEPTALGTAFVLAQAAAVAMFTVMEGMALRR